MLSSELFVKALLSGFILGMGLIFSIGPQNLQLFRAGATNDNSISIATTGYISEIIIVIGGVIGVGSPMQTAPVLGEALRALGIAFLTWYGITAIARSREGRMLEQATAPVRTRRQAIIDMLTVTWLNPLVYVEVMFLVGVLSSGFGNVARFWFGAGYLAASAIRFYGWSFAGRLLQSWISRPGRSEQFSLVSGCLLLCAAGVLTGQVAGFI